MIAPAPGALTLITSAAYINAEMAAEFGAIPPCFLPIGHSRLCDIQADRAAALGGRIVITVPKSFTPTDWEADSLAARGIEILPIPDALSLGESVRFALIMTGAIGAVRILHGDTLFAAPLPEELDIVSVADPPDAYEWGRIGGGEELRVLSGFFAFSSAPDLVRAITIAGGDFVKGLEAYASAYQPLAQRVIDAWFDCGHLQTYYRARAQVTTSRAFNSLKIDRRIVEKSSSDSAKLDFEAAWYENIPAGLKLYTPFFLGARAEGGAVRYALAYELNPTLHELFVFGRLGEAVWLRILNACAEFLSLCLATKPDGAGPHFRDFVAGKTGARLASYARATGTSLDREWRINGVATPSLTHIAETAAALIGPDSEQARGVMHGDFCFTNIFYDFRQRAIKVIDPRGSLDGRTPSIFGDVRYDLAKLAHSLYGYDLILSGRYAYAAAGHDVTLTLAAGPDRIGELAGQVKMAGRSIHDPEIVAIAIHLFLSMLPLHADRPDRQGAFLANALRLYALLEAGS